MSASPSVRRVIVGTAGHIDHGKTTLVERLTGVRTDRLPEEQARGMTIDVGYAEFRLEDGTEVGLLDVPGHERLVRTMVAGATSMDVVLLVIAADDGPMLQTREHLDVIDLLGIRRGVVALTKTDLAGPARTDEVAEQIATLLRGTSLEGSPVVRVSSKTGKGVPDVRAALAVALPPADEAADDLRAFRMPILRAFVAPGRGTVVTGIPAAGRIVPGDEVVLLPAGEAGRVRSLQVHHRSASVARAGHRTALLIPELHPDRVARGMVVAAADSLEPVERVAVRLRVLRHVAKPLPHGFAMRVHVGTDDVRARLHVLDADRVAPGAVTAVELEGLRPFLVAPGDRFVFREDNASDTLGGGVIVECLAARLPRRRAGLVTSILEAADALGRPAAVASHRAARAGEKGISPERLARSTGLRVAALPAMLEPLVAGGALRRAGGLVFDAAGFDRLRTSILEALAKEHAKDAAVATVPLVALRASLRAVPAEAFDAALADLVGTGDVKKDSRGGVAWARHVTALPPEDAERCGRVHDLLRAAGGKPPDEATLATSLALPSPAVRRALGLLETRRSAVRVGTLWFDAAWIERARSLLTALGKGGATFQASQACAALETTRKYGIPLLEWFDAEGLTRRDGALRVLVPAREPPADAAPL